MQETYSASVISLMIYTVRLQFPILLTYARMLPLLLIPLICQ